MSRAFVEIKKWSYNSNGLDSNNFEIMLILFTRRAPLYDSLHLFSLSIAVGCI